MPPVSASKAYQDESRVGDSTLQPYRVVMSLSLIKGHTCDRHSEIEAVEIDNS